MKMVSSNCVSSHATEVNLMRWNAQEEEYVRKVESKKNKHIRGRKNFSNTIPQANNVTNKDLATSGCHYHTL